MYLNDGKANFPKRIPFGPADATIRMAAAADLAGSGLMDIVAIDERRGTFIYYNRSDGTFSGGVRLEGTAYGFAIGDLDEDG